MRVRARWLSAPARPGVTTIGARVAVGTGVVLALLGSAAVALAGSPSPTAAAGGDPRSSGQGPGLVGDPVAAIVLVAAIALASLVATLLYVRLTGGPRDVAPRPLRPPPPRPRRPGAGRPRGRRQG